MNLRTKLSVTVCFLATCAAGVWAAACSSSDNGSPAGGQEGGTMEGSSSSSGGGGDTGTVVTDSGGGPHEGGIADASEGGGVGVLIDNMTATMGTQISLVVPAGEAPGSYYTYFDKLQNFDLFSTGITSTGSLLDMPVTPALPQADGTSIVGELCVQGIVVNYAGLGMSFAYGHAPDASPESGVSAPVPFDASKYSGVSFYIFEDPSDGAPLKSIHFGIPDTQTADPAALPNSDCAVLDGGVCDDDFGSDVSHITPGVWTKVSFQFSDLSQQLFGNPQPAAINTHGLIGMKWQANGDGHDAASEAFNFCISNIYFTP